MKCNSKLAYIITIQLLMYNVSAGYPAPGDPHLRSEAPGGFVQPILF
jgi:hypothetical protein